MISKLHYITQDVFEFTHAELVELACKGGVDWVQLRIKSPLFNSPQRGENPPPFGKERGWVEWKKIALETQTICKKYNATFIINDNVQLAKEINADGVHLGKEDMGIGEARKILGNNFIIGGSANTIEDVKRLIAAGADYIGLGPFRFTSTKEKLNPILGIDGIKKIVRRFAPFGGDNEGAVPFIAIGGIRMDDVPEILSNGIHGIAISSAINLAEDKTQTAKEFIQKISEQNISSNA